MISPEQVKENLSDVLNEIKEETEKAGRTSAPTLVAVSKTKPIDLIMAAYSNGQRHFGENYVQEIVEKAPKLPTDIIWHFIGHLQSNKVKDLINGVPNLGFIHGVDSEKLATKLQHQLELTHRTIQAMIEVRTSPEESKVGGVETSNVFPLAKFILEKCPNIKLIGLMTIEQPGNWTCFDKLAELSKSLSSQINLGTSDVPSTSSEPSSSTSSEKHENISLELSMGMSDSFKEAIKRGATYVRIGSTIFGKREKKTSKTDEVKEISKDSIKEEEKKD